MEKRFAVFGSGYNPAIPTCFVFADALDNALELARRLLDGRSFVERVEEWP